MTPYNVPPPILFNAWKHHAGFLRQRIADAIEAGPAVLADLPIQLLIIGTELMDLYTGVMTPAEIAQGLINQLA